MEITALISTYKINDEDIFTLDPEAPNKEDISIIKQLRLPVLRGGGVPNPNIINFNVEAMNSMLGLLNSSFKAVKSNILSEINIEAFKPVLNTDKNLQALVEDFRKFDEAYDVDNFLKLADSSENLRFWKCLN